MNNVWLELMKTLGSVTVISGFIVWLIQRVIALFFSHNLEKFKSDLQKEALTHQIRYETMHAERAQVTKNLYAKLTMTHRDLGSLMSMFQAAGDISQVEKTKKAAESANEFTDYFEQNKIFLDKKLASKIEVLSKTFRSAWIKYDTHKMLNNHSNESMKYWEDSWDIINKRVPEIKQEIEHDFRAIIGIEDT